VRKNTIKKSGKILLKERNPSKGKKRRQGKKGVRTKSKKTGSCGERGIGGEERKRGGKNKEWGTAVKLKRSWKQQKGKSGKPR